MRQPIAPRKEEELWSGRPRGWAAPIRHLTERYSLTNQRLKIEYGFLNRKTEEIELFRVMDLSVERSMFDRMFGVGNVVVHSGDTTGSVTILYDLHDAEKVKDLLRDESRIERQRNRVGVFEDTFVEGAQ